MLLWITAHLPDSLQDASVCFSSSDLVSYLCIACSGTRRGWPEDWGPSFPPAVPSWGRPVWDWRCNRSAACAAGTRWALSSHAWISLTSSASTTRTEWIWCPLSDTQWQVLPQTFCSFTYRKMWLKLYQLFFQHWKKHKITFNAKWL